MKEYVKRRDQAVLSNDVNKFNEFVEWGYKKHYFNEAYYKSWCKASDLTKQITLQKMACEITSIPKERKQEAATWLLQHGFFPGLRG